MKPFLLFAFTVSVMAQDPGAIFQDAMSKMQQAGVPAQRGDFGPANELINAAAEGMDRAVELAPEKVEFRARRGVAYSFLSYLPGKAQTALEDLKFATTSPTFSNLPDDLRQQAIRQLASLITHPDRFPSIPDSTTPLVAVASFTVPAAAGSIPEWVDATVKALKGSPGLLGTHAMSSIDHPGMFVVFTWWEDKKSLNDFFYVDLHQDWMRQRGLTISRVASSPVPADQMPS
jgi:heme-degrading monooxygenase HmoA